MEGDKSFVFENLAAKMALYIFLYKGKAMRILFCLWILMSLVCAGELKILAAANLKMVLEEIKQEFLKDYLGEQIEITYLSSGKAYAQIKNGLEVDLFFSADTQKPQKLAQEGFALLDSQVYALGKLVLCTATHLNISTNSSLTSPKVKHIAIANPKLAPYGEAAEAFLKNINLYDKLKDKLVIGDSIGQALNFVKTENAELGLSALSLVIFDKTMTYRILDKNLYPPIEQAFIILKKSKNEKLARAFARFVMSETGRKIFERFGYDR